MEPGVKFPCYK